jgi:hypothetical protein
MNKKLNLPIDTKEKKYGNTSVHGISSSRFENILGAMFFINSFLAIKSIAFFSWTSQTLVI